jgi:hypothetical protein
MIDSWAAQCNQTREGAPFCQRIWNMCSKVAAWNPPAFTPGKSCLYIKGQQGHMLVLVRVTRGEQPRNRGLEKRQVADNWQARVLAENSVLYVPILTR